MAMTEDEAKELQALVRTVLEKFTPGRTARGRKPATCGMAGIKIEDAERMEELALI